MKKNNTNITKRTKLPQDNADKTVFLSDNKCCVCESRGDHIHHIDGKNTNHNIENLAYLCFEHHSEASMTTNIRRRLSAGAIKRFRESWYKRVEAKREIPFISVNSHIKQLSEADLLTAALNANIILEVDKIGSQYVRANNEKKRKILGKLLLYEDYKNVTISNHILTFLTDVAENTRSEKSASIAEHISFGVSTYFPPYSKTNKRQMNELGYKATYIGFCVAYDSAIYTENLWACMMGLEILNNVYATSILHKLPVVNKSVLDQFSELEQTLQRPERDDLKNARKLVDIYKNALGTEHGGLDKIPKDLWEIIKSHQNK